MKLILSRKGFDSSAGGCPSPVFPDGRFLALPIPDQQSPVRYSDLQYEGLNVGELVADLTGDPGFRDQGAHLDPDLIPGMVARKADWRPSLGQINQAQGHLRNQGVSEGDLFLFFGLFRHVEYAEGRWRFDRQSHAFHALWGWLQVDEVWPVDAALGDRVPWVRDHPHFHREPNPSNTLYVARDHLDPGSGVITGLGAGVFTAMNENLRLTTPGSRKVSDWHLPRFLYPAEGKPPLSQHRDLKRWQLDGDRCRLQCVPRGQEFVLDTAYYPEATSWIETLVRDHSPIRAAPPGCNRAWPVPGPC